MDVGIFEKSRRLRIARISDMLSPGSGLLNLDFEASQFRRRASFIQPVF
jgi:hypothetical protein